MPDTTPSFQPGAHVIYGGSLWQRWGVMYVTAVRLTNSGWLYDLEDPIWGGYLHGVRESSLRDATLDLGFPAARPPDQTGRTT